MVSVRAVVIRFTAGVAAVLAFAPVMPLALSAQQPAAAPPEFVLLNVVEVRPDSMADYVALQKSETMPALQKAGIEWRDAWRAATFGDAFTIAYVTPIKSFAQFDEPPPTRRALGEEGYRTYIAKLRKLTNGVRMYALRGRPDLGYRSDGAAMPKLAVLASIEVNPGHQQEWESFVKNDWGPALKKGGVPSYSVSQVIFGGNIAEYHTFTPIANFAELDKGHPIQRAMGEDALNKLMAKVGPSIHRAERIIIRYDDELSFRVKTTSDAR
jgi:hypothetical protein